MTLLPSPAQGASLESTRCVCRSGSAGELQSRPRRAAEGWRSFASAAASDLDFNRCRAQRALVRCAPGFIRARSLARTIRCVARALPARAG